MSGKEDGAAVTTAKPRFCAGCGKQLPELGTFYTFFTVGDGPSDRTCYDKRCVDLRNAMLSARKEKTDE